MKNTSLGQLVGALSFFCLIAFGQASLADEKKGKVTGLDIPRFVSLKTIKGNVRRGPSLAHRIDWVFKRRNMPLQVTAEHEHWRRVQDRDGLGGWIHYSLISGTRTVIVQQDELLLRNRPKVNSSSVAKMQFGVVARLGKCNLEWCHLTVDSYRGWVPKSRIWGVKPDEIRE